jgi:hypothetical protein
VSLSLSAKQAAFFKKNGHLELEAFLSEEESIQLHAALVEELERRKQNGHPFPRRDLWRSLPSLQTLLLSRKCTQVALELSLQSSLKIGFDHWIGGADSRPVKIQDFSSIQGVACAVLLRLTEEASALPSKTPLGLDPFPQAIGNALFVNPSLLLNWPRAASPSLYLATYCLPSSVYVHNPKDPDGAYLKALGYGYGDPLSNQTHPLFFLKRS